MKPLSFIIIVCCMAMVFSCRKDSFITGSGASLSASEDTLHFDTLFSTVGSVTHYFKVFNQNDRKLLISSISLGGGSSSYFKINADGFAGPVISNIEMEANDSLYVFVTVKIDPGADNLPFVVEDSVRILFNGNQKWVQLQAWGQNAHFYHSRVITTATTWTNDKPHVITGGLLISRQARLTIEKGTRIYLHADAPLLVDGVLVAEGESYDSTRIVFQGDRLDDPYDGFPGGWPGIYFTETSKNNILEYVTIKNAYQGIVVQSPSVNGEPKVTLRQCIIDNCYDSGIFGLGSDIEAENCLISNCGKNIMLLYGGKYRFTHCTDVAYSNELIQHKQPVLAVTDFIQEGNTVRSADLDAVFINCLFWGANGSVEDEVVTSKKGSGLFNVDFRNCLWKIKDQPPGVITSGIISNEDPAFVATDQEKDGYNFRLGDGSPAIASGLPAGLMTDLDGHPRNMSTPDIGAFEHQP